MRWCRFELRGVPCFGRVDGDRIVRIEGTPFENPRDTTESIALASATLLPPTIPNTFFSAGVNYRHHILEAQAKGSTMAKFPTRPETGYRANNGLLGHDGTIVKPKDYEGRFEAEPELVAVIGRKIRRASKDECRAAILGWTIGNDVSARAWQYADRTLWRGKNCDTFKPMGPWIETAVDPMKSRTLVRLNGPQVAEFATGEMIFDPFDYMVEITKYITMSPGDVLWMGSDGNVGIAPGDVIEIEITGVGTLRNRVVLETRAKDL